MKKRTKIGIAIFFVLLALPISLFWFFQKTDAPILHGKVDFCIKYKGDHQLDIYEPTKEVHTKRPVLIYYHGGAWVGGNKITVNNNRFNETFNTLREKGYAIVSPNYTLAEFKVSPFPACIADAIDVVSWIEQNAVTYNFDTNNVGVLGESAGGHLALMTAYSELEKFTKPHNIPLNYVVAVYPPTDLRKLYMDQEEMRGMVKQSTVGLPTAVQEYFNLDQYLFGFDTQKDPIKANELTQLYSPIHFIKEAIPKTLLIHGNKDRVVPISQSLVLKEKLDSMNIPVQFHTLDGVDHAFLNATPEQKEQAQKWITDFVLNQYAE